MRGADLVTGTGAFLTNGVRHLGPNERLLLIKTSLTQKPEPSMKRSLPLVTTVIAALISGAALADTIKISGATTVLNVVVGPAKDSVEKSTGHTLAMIGSGTGKGMVDLFDVASDIAMVSEPMDIAAEAALVAGKKIDPSKVQVFELKKDEIVFVVHPSNPDCDCE